jgi:chemotaxis protein methyltransferase WspC
MPTILADVEQLLKESMGLDATSIGSMPVERALRERQQACALPDPPAYLYFLRGSASELQALVEAVVVNETWFLREPKAFEAMLQMAQEARLEQRADGVLRILSLPCATGEEPYSMAIALLDGGIAPERFRIDAVDISERAIADAQRARYGNNSFRGAELGFRERYFTRVGQAYELGELPRRQVRFQQGNIFAGDFLPGVDLYDIIFCRNVLIYFDRPMQQRAIEVLARLLRPDGRLFVAAAEASLPQAYGFVSSRIPQAFALRRASVEAAPTAPAAPKSKPAAPASARRAAPPAAPAPPPAAWVRPATDMAGNAGGNVLEQAARMADRGQLAEAAALCEQDMRANGPTPGALHLMGLIEDARGDQAQAAHYYRKVLYLDAQHPEALIHLACLLEQRGDGTGARLLRERLDRANAKRGAP